MDILQELLGCQWGRRVGTVEDPDCCPATAIQIVVLHRDGQDITVKLCGYHRDIVLAETDPHVEV